MMKKKKSTFVLKLYCISWCSLCANILFLCNFFQCM
uniref:Uncharacterized protein n=1 Tax=Rhizophora mucronata TaxID=61149 RepID=A0A2P2NXG9_RHIMU